MNKKLAILLVVVVLIFSGVAYKLSSRQSTGITATGTVEITRVDITPRLSGYIKDLKLDTGDKIQSKITLFEIDRQDLSAQILSDQANLAKSEALLADIIKGARPQEREEAASNMASAESVFVKARNDYNRLLELFIGGAISQQQLDMARSNFEVAKNSFAVARARLDLVEEGTRPDQIEAQKKTVEQLSAVLTANKTILADTKISSPISGIVLSKNFENGEYVNAGSSVLTVANLEDCWIKIYISSNQLGLIQLGQAAKIKVDSFPDKIFVGKIKEISSNAEFTPRQSITERERANLVFAVKVKVDNEKLLLKPGMPADVILMED